MSFMARRSLATRLLLSLLLSLLLLVALLGAVELWMRLRDSPGRADFRFRRITPAVAEDREGRYVPNLARFWTLAPNFRHSPTHLGREATGDWPFRGRPPEPSPPGLLRVAVVGDSVVYGTTLDAADIPGSCIQDALARRGWTPDRVAVISLGVPGYSTLQLFVLLQEQLGSLKPDAVVLWPAAWNDQAPAMIASDRNILKERGEHPLREWARDHSRLVDALVPQRNPLPLDEILAGWNRGVPPNGFRVSGGDVGSWVTFALASCDTARVPAVVLASAHPPRTAADHPRTRSDAATVIEAATRAGVPVVDAQALLDAASLEASRSFVDYVHPSAETNALLGEALAQALFPLLETRAAERAARAESLSSSTYALSIVEASPREVPVLGDATLRVTLAGWTRGELLPAVIVGGAPLIDVRAAGEHEVEGTLMANAPGRHELVVQSAGGCAWLPDAIEYREPAIRIEAPPGEAASLVVSARPGDGVRVLVAAGRAPQPSWSPRGAYWLDDSARPLPGDRVADEQGLAIWTFDQAPPGTFLVQVLVAPAGEAPDAGLGSRWTSVVELSAPSSPAAPAPSSPAAR
jgi:hypothetical protein